MLIGIRVDASLKMGTGHTYRMLTLACQLQKHGHKVVFICRRLQGNLIEFVKNSFEVLELPAPDASQRLGDHCVHAPWLEVSYELEITQTYQLIDSYLVRTKQQKLDWLIIDHYGIEKEFQLFMQPLMAKCMQVDDLADRQHEVDVLLDQNFYPTDDRYDKLLPSQALRLCGPQYALLRDEFEIARQQLGSYEIRLEAGEVVVFFGGIDAVNETYKALLGLLSVESEDHFHVIIGINNPHKEAIEALCLEHSGKVSLHIQVKNMTVFLASTYLFVGAVGATTWERCAMALPGLVCSVADNQQQVATNLQNLGAHCYLGLNTELTSEDYRNAYQHLLANKAVLKGQSELCAQLVDGNGCLKVVSYLENIAH